MSNGYNIATNLGPTNALIVAVDTVVDGNATALDALNDISTAQVNTEVDNALNTAIPGSPAGGSVNDVLKLIDTGKIDIPAYVVVSDDILISNDNEGTDSNLAYEKKKEIFCPVHGTIRVKFDIKINNGGNDSKGRIYKNGVGFGTEQVNNTANYVTYSEDLIFAAGDTIELWCLKVGGTTYSYRNLRIYGKIYERFENILT